MYNMAPFEDLDETHAEPPPKWAAHFSGHLEDAAVKNKEDLRKKQKSTQSADPSQTQPPPLYYREDDGHLEAAFELNSSFVLLILNKMGLHQVCLSVLSLQTRNLGAMLMFPKRYELLVYP